MQNYRLNRLWQGHRDSRRRLPRLNRERIPHVTIEQVLANPEDVPDNKPEGVIEDATPQPEQPHIESNVEPLSEAMPTPEKRRKPRDRRSLRAET